MRGAFLSVLAVALVVLVPVAVDCGGSDGNSVTLSDGITYGYTTDGYNYQTYAAVMQSASTDGDSMFLSTTLEGYNVKGIAPGALHGENVRQVVVPERVATIGDDAFGGCPHLEAVVFMGDRPEMGPMPEGVEVYCMPGTSGWDQDVPRVAVREVSERGSSVRVADIFGRNTVVGAVPDADGTVVVPGKVDGRTVDSVGPYSFAGRDNRAGTDVAPRTDVHRVVLPEGLTEIRERAFYYCTGLEHVDLPCTLTTVMDEAFRADRSLGDVDLPDGLGYIGFEAFRQCGGFRHVDIPDSVGFVGEGAFKICRGVETLVLGAGVGSVLPWTFAYMDALESVDIAGDLTELGPQSFYMCGSLKDIVLPGTVTDLGDEAFLECTSMESVALGDSLGSIGKSAFKGCVVLDGVTVPDTVRSIGDKAFAYCDSMEDIYFEGEMPVLGRGVFLNAPVTVHVTEECADTWEGFDGSVVVDSGGFPYAALAVVLLAISAVVVLIVVKRRG